MSVFLLLCEPWQPSVGCGIESISLHSCTEGSLPSHFLYYTRSLSRHMLLVCPCSPCSRKTKIPLPLPRLDSTLKGLICCCPLSLHLAALATLTAHTVLCLGCCALVGQDGFLVSTVHSGPSRSLHESINTSHSCSSVYQYSQ